MFATLCDAQTIIISIQNHIGSHDCTNLQDGGVMFGAALTGVTDAISTMLTWNASKLSKALTACLLSRRTVDLLARVCCDVLKRCIAHGG